VQAIGKLTTPYKQGFVPPAVTNWNDADDNNAFHAKLVVMDFDGTISTEVALYRNREEYNDLLTLACRSAMRVKNCRASPAPRPR
jgi:multiple sugar transport system substrate-binding protein